MCGSSFFFKCSCTEPWLAGSVRVKPAQAAAAGGAWVKSAPAGSRSHSQAPAGTHSLTHCEPVEERGCRECSRLLSRISTCWFAPGEVVKGRADGLRVFPACRYVAHDASVSSRQSVGDLDEQKFERVYSWHVADDESGYKEDTYVFFLFSFLVFESICFASSFYFFYSRHFDFLYPASILRSWPSLHYLLD